MKYYFGFIICCALFSASVQSQFASSHAGLTKELDVRISDARLLPRKTVGTIIPDGVLISVKDTGQAPQSLYRMRPDGTGRRLIIFAENGTYVNNARWSQNLSNILYVSGSSSTGYGQLWVADSSGHYPRQLSNVTPPLNIGAQPEFVSPTKIWYSLQQAGWSEIYEIGTDGTGNRQVSNGAGESKEYNRNVFSVDGSRVYFCKTTPYSGPSSEIYSANLDFSAQKRLTNNSTTDYEHDISPDGKKIVWCEETPVLSGIFNIFTMNSDGTNQVQITSFASGNAYYPRWSPDGTQILYSRFDNQQWDVHLVTADGSRDINITQTGSMDEYVCDWKGSSPGLLFMTAFGGEEWLMGSTNTLKWHADSSIGSISIEYSLDNGSTWDEIATNIMASSESYSWVVPQIAHTPNRFVLVRILSSSDSSIYTTKKISIIGNSLERGLVAYYPFNGNTIDSSGNGYQVDNHGATLTVDRFNRNNQSYYFDGGSYMLLSDSSKALTWEALSDEYSISIWINFASIPSHHIHVLMDRTDDGPWSYYLNLEGSSGKMFYGPADLQPGRTLPLGNTVYLPNRWYHLVESTHDGRVDLYVDGILDCTYNLPTDFVSTRRITDAITFGTFFNPGMAPVDGLIGNLDDIRIYNRSLADSEITTLYMGANAGMSPQIVIQSLSDDDALFSTSIDRHLKTWGIRLYKKYISPLTLVAKTDSSVLVYSKPDPDLYYVVEADSENWVHLGNVLNDSADESSQNIFSINVEKGGSYIGQFVNGLPNAVTIRSLSDDGGDIATTGDRHPQNWHLRLYRDSVAASMLIAEELADTVLTVSKLAPGNYVAWEGDSLDAWKHIGRVVNNDTRYGPFDTAAFLVGNGRTQFVTFLNYDTRAGNIWTGAIDCEKPSLGGNWTKGRPPEAGDTIIVPNYACPLTLSDPMTIRRLSLWTGQTLSLTSDSLNVTEDISYSGTLRAGACTITTTGNWNQLPQGTFEPGTSKVIFKSTNTPVINGGHFNVIELTNGRIQNNDVHSVYTGEAVVVKVESTLVVRGTLEEFNNVIIIENPDPRAIQGGGNISGGTIIRNILQGSTESYRFDKESTYVRFDSGTQHYPSSIVFSSKSTPQLKHDLTRCDSTKRDHLNLIISCRIKHFSKYYIGTPRPKFGESATNVYPINKFYEIQGKEVSGGIDAILSVKLDPADLSEGVVWDSLYVYVDDDPTTSVESSHDQIPESAILLQNYPNPFNPTSTIIYQLATESRVWLKVFNLLGQEVRTLVNATEESGEKSVTIDAGTLPTGIYFYHLDATSVSDPTKHFSQTRKMLLVK